MEHALGISTGRAALAIAHPGHELRVHGWLCRAKPLVFVLTDGSGRQGKSRLFATSRILQQAGAAQGGIFGRFPDRQVYQAVLAENSLFFLQLAEELAGELVKNRIDVVVGDAEERAILAHDLWRGVVNRAVALAEDELSQPIASYEFPLETPQAAPATLGGAVVQLPLSTHQIIAKITAAESYRGLSHDIDSALAHWKEEDIGTECFFPSQARDGIKAATDSLPRYELHGERQVAAGTYSKVVRYREHVLPILQALQSGLRGSSLRRTQREAA